MSTRLFYDETQGEIKTYCILDRDYHTKEEVEDLYRRAEESHLQLHVWQKKEIENYLLSPRALSIIAGIDPDSTDYQRFCDELFLKINELREDTLGKVLDQLQLQDKSKSPSFFLPQANAILENSWGTLADRMSFAGGKDAISLVNQWIHDRYHRNSSRAKILSTLSASDIPEEMRAVIDELLS